jgi:hypothetical protein
LRTGNQFDDFMLAFAAEGTVKKLVARFGHEALPAGDWEEKPPLTWRLQVFSLELDQ